jgi:hypothetical protein
MPRRLQVYQSRQVSCQPPSADRPELNVNVISAIIEQSIFDKALASYSTSHEGEADGAAIEVRVMHSALGHSECTPWRFRAYVPPLLTLVRMWCISTAEGRRHCL